MSGPVDFHQIVQLFTSETFHPSEGSSIPINSQSPLLAPTPSAGWPPVHCLSPWFAYSGRFLWIESWNMWAFVSAFHLTRFQGWLMCFIHFCFHGWIVLCWKDPLEACLSVNPVTRYSCSLFLLFGALSIYVHILQELVFSSLRYVELVIICEC